MPFEIPNNWSWVRIETIFGSISSRDSQILASETLSEGLFAVVSQSQDFIDGYSDDDTKVIYDNPVIIFGDHTKIVKYVDFPFILGADGTKVLKPILCNPKFLYYLVYDAANKINPKGYARHYKLLKQSILTLPPLDEQQRIVERIESIFKQIDLIESNQNDYTNLVEALKKSILQSAIQGTLVEQDENDEPASILLEKIRAEKKAQLGKKYVESYIYRGDDNRYYEHIGEKDIDITEKIPFDLPLGWCWDKISNVTIFQEGPGILAVDFRDKGIPLIRIAGMKGAFVSLEGCNYLDEEMVSKKWHHFRLDKGDIVISTSASMDKIAEVNEDTVGAIPYTGLIRFKMTSCLLSSYFKYFIRSPYYMRQIDEQKSGALISHYGPSHLNKMIIPIPPLSEQERIVRKINEIFAQL